MRYGTPPSAPSAPCPCPPWLPDGRSSSTWCSSRAECFTLHVSGASRDAWRSGAQYLQQPRHHSMNMPRSTGFCFEARCRGWCCVGLRTHLPLMAARMSTASGALPSPPLRGLPCLSAAVAARSRGASSCGQARPGHVRKKTKKRSSSLRTKTSLLYFFEEKKKSKNYLRVACMDPGRHWLTELCTFVQRQHATKAPA